MSAREWIAARRELLDAATEGPWELRSYMDREYSVYAPRWPGIVAELGIGAEDTALIADARTSTRTAHAALRTPYGGKPCERPAGHTGGHGNAARAWLAES